MNPAVHSDPEISLPIAATLPPEVERSTRRDAPVTSVPWPKARAGVVASSVEKWGPWLFLGLVAACAIFPGALAPYSPTDMQADRGLVAPAVDHLFGTDQFGRDVFSLVIYGARQSVLIGMSSVIVGGSLGLLLGLGAGYLGRTVDIIVMRFIDMWMSIPSTLLAIIVATALGPSLFHTILAISAVTVPRYTRVMRGQVLSVRRRPFVDASRSVGTSHPWIVLRHVLPHCASPLLVLLTLGVGHAILIGSALSFLGLGVVEERPDWGYLLTEGRGYLTVAWWISTFPGLAITALLLAVNVLGERLRHRAHSRGTAV